MFYLPFVIFEPEDTMDIMDTSPQQESIAILIREESDISTIKEVFGDAVLLSINPVTSRDPRSIKDLSFRKLHRGDPVLLLLNLKIKEEFLTNSSRTVYQELLKTANRIVGQNISPTLPCTLHCSTKRFASRFLCMNL